MALCSTTRTHYPRHLSKKVRFDYGPQKACKVECLYSKSQTTWQQRWQDNESTTTTAGTMTATTPVNPLSHNIYWDGTVGDVGIQRKKKRGASSSNTKMGCEKTRKSTHFAVKGSTRCYISLLRTKFYSTISYIHIFNCKI